MKINRCIHCMQEMGEGVNLCPYCRKRQEYPTGYNGLRPNTILHGRYLTGLLTEENTYIAFDLATGRRISVKEFYPRSLAWREGNVVVPYHVPGEEWAKGLEEFLRLGNALLQQPPDLNLPRVLEVFQENGTAYIALYEPVVQPSGHNLYDDIVEDRDSSPEKFEFELGDARGIVRRPKSSGIVRYFQGVRSVLRPTAKNLQWLHRNGFMHRQIEPSGMRRHWEENCILFCLSFPLLSGEVRGGGHRAGVSAPGHIDPFAPLEEFGAKLPKGPWTDVYSLCAVLYFYITEQEPPDALSRLDGGERLPGLPADLTRSQRAVLEDGMALQPKDRIQSIDELLRRVDESLKSPGGFDPAQNMPQVVYGPPPQQNDVSNACPSCGFRWKSPAMLPKPKFCIHCGEKLPGWAG